MAGPKITTATERHYKKLVPISWDCVIDEKDGNINGFWFESSNSRIRLYLPENLSVAEFKAKIELQSAMMVGNDPMEAFQAIAEAKVYFDRVVALGYKPSDYAFLMDTTGDYLQIKFDVACKDKAGLEKLISDITPLAK